MMQSKMTNGSMGKPFEEASPVSDEALRSIVDQGFFGTLGSLADARSACAELLFARSMIEAQTAKIVQLTQPVEKIIP